MDILILNTPFNADILTMTENMLIWTVTNKLKLLVAATICIYTTFQVIWYFVKVCHSWDNQFVITYAPMTFNNFYASMTILQIFVQHFQFKDGVRFIRKNFWSLEQAEKEARMEISLDMATSRKLMLFTLFLIMLSPVIYLPFTGIDYNNTLFPTIEMLSHAKVGKPLKFTILCFNYLVLFPQSYFMGMHLFTLNYFVTQYRYQVVMIKWSLVNTKKELRALGFTNDDIIANSCCQNVIKKRLVACVKHHWILIAIAKYTVRFFYKTFFYHTFVGIVLITTHTYIILFHHVGTSPMAVVINAVAGLFVVALYGIFGEIFQEQTDIMSDAIKQSNWELFSKENKKILMILFLNLKRKYYITGYGLFPINCQFVVWVLNKMFALLSVLSVMEEYPTGVN
nr:odorant receptor 28 [Pachyrhinus yasumatsui]